MLWPCTFQESTYGHLRGISTWSHLLIGYLCVEWLMTRFKNGYYKDMYSSATRLVTCSSLSWNLNLEQAQSLVHLHLHIGMKVTLLPNVNGWPHFEVVIIIIIIIKINNFELVIDESGYMYIRHWVPNFDFFW